MQVLSQTGMSNSSSSTTFHEPAVAMGYIYSKSYDCRKSYISRADMLFLIAMLAAFTTLISLRADPSGVSHQRDGAGGWFQLSVGANLSDSAGWGLPAVNLGSSLTSK